MCMRFVDKVQENRNNLAKLSNVQNTILKQVNSLTTVTPGTPVYPVASSPASPPWANQILDQGKSVVNYGVYYFTYMN